MRPAHDKHDTESDALRKAEEEIKAIKVQGLSIRICSCRTEFMLSQTSMFVSVFDHNFSTRSARVDILFCNNLM